MTKKSIELEWLLAAGVGLVGELFMSFALLALSALIAIHAEWREKRRLDWRIALFVLVLIILAILDLPSFR